MGEDQDHGLARRRRGRAAAGVVTLLLAGALGAARGGAPAVGITGVVYLGDLPTIVAEEEGLFAAAGLEAAVSYGQSGKDNLRRLRAGQTDFALMAVAPPLLDRLADTTPGGPDDPVILANLLHATRLNQVVALAASGIERPADLSGRRVGLMRGTNAEFIWWLFALSHQLDPDTAELVDTRIERLPDALAERAIDAAVLWEPWTARLEQRWGERLRVLPGSTLHGAKWLLVTRRRFAEDNPGICRAVLRAYTRAIDRIGAAPRASLARYAARVGLPVAALAARWESFSYDLGLDWSLAAAMHQQLDWAQRAGYLGEGPPPDPLALIAPAPLAAVAPAAVSLHGRLQAPGASEDEPRPAP